MTPVELLLSKLPDAKSVGPNKWIARCPAHDDRRPSLSISEGDDGRALVHCHAGCAPEAAAAAVGLKLADLMPPKTNGTHKSAQPRRIVATSDYRTAAGELAYQVVRYDPKDFRQRRPDGKGGWLWSMDGITRILYRLPEVLAASPETFVFVVEGEKDCDNLAAAGLTATCNPGGAGKWSKVDDSPLAGRHVVIVPDADQPGLKHARDVAERLTGRAASVRIVYLPGNGKDASDWLAAGGDAKQLVELAVQAGEWKPTDAVEQTEAPAPPLSRTAECFIQPFTL